MAKILFPLTNLKKTENSSSVDSGIKICVLCGHSLVDICEFGISCEKCGSFLVFCQDQLKKNRRTAE